MTAPGMQLAPHEMWQTVYAPGVLPGDPQAGFAGVFPATLPDGRQIALPIRTLPGDGTRAVASLIINQASFAVQHLLADVLAAQLAAHGAEVVIGLPTLGLGLAAGVAERLGHGRFVPLGTSRKFWYSDELSQPMRSITSPDADKRLYVDPRMLPLVAGRRVALVDDVASTGSTLAAALGLLGRAGVRPVVAGFAMLQGTGWRAVAPCPVEGAITTPRLELGGDGRWRPAE